jgi:hypothetical protein
MYGISFVTVVSLGSLITSLRGNKLNRVYGTEPTIQYKHKSARFTTAY